MGTQLMNASILIVTALPEELDHPKALYTGVGKLNATYAITKPCNTASLPLW